MKTEEWKCLDKYLSSMAVYLLCDCSSCLSVFQRQFLRRQALKKRYKSAASRGERCMWGWQQHCRSAGGRISSGAGQDVVFGSMVVHWMETVLNVYGLFSLWSPWLLLGVHLSLLPDHGACMDQWISGERKGQSETHRQLHAPLLLIRDLDVAAAVCSLAGYRSFTFSRSEKAVCRRCWHYTLPTRSRGFFLNFICGCDESGIWCLWTWSF